MATKIFDRIPQQSKDFATMMPESAKELLLAFGRRNLTGIPAEAVEFLKANALIDYMPSVNGNWAWIVTPEGKRVRKALEVRR
jgi:hypothetical protein